MNTEYEMLRIAATQHKYPMIGKIVVLAVFLGSVLLLCFSLSKTSTNPVGEEFVLGLFGLAVSGIVGAFVANLVVARAIIEKIEQLNQESGER